MKRLAPLVASLLVAPLVLVLSHPIQLRAADNSALAAATLSITAGELQRDVDELASDSYEGREAGSRGGRAAGAWIRGQLRELGLQPDGVGGDYFQPFSGADRNLLAVVEGSDPQLAGEYILVGAHYDHVGYGNPDNSFGPYGYIHNGADDNASGVATLLEVAEALKRAPRPPKRSVLLAFWDAEESGLNGSKYWIAHPSVPRSAVKFAFNADMVGRARAGRLIVYGTRSGWGVRRLLSQETEGTDLWLDFTWELEANSDHWTFLSNGIPTVMFHTGLHENYHRPSDDANLINSAGMQDVARVLFLSVYSLADADSITPYRAQGRRESEGNHRALERPLAPLPPRLGVTWDPTAPSSDQGVEIRSVNSGTPADRAGLRAGQRIVQLGGYATPAGDPARIGLAWRVDEAEPNEAILTRVVPGSPAYRAGLKALDRVYQVNGEDVAGRDAFRDQLLADVDQPIHLVVERRGRLQNITIDARSPETVETPLEAADEN